MTSELESGELGRVRLNINHGAYIFINQKGRLLKIAANILKHLCVTGKKETKVQNNLFC